MTLQYLLFSMKCKPHETTSDTIGNNKIASGLPSPCSSCNTWWDYRKSTNICSQPIKTSFYCYNFIDNINVEPNVKVIVSYLIQNMITPYVLGSCQLLCEKNFTHRELINIYFQVYPWDSGHEMLCYKTNWQT